MSVHLISAQEAMARYDQFDAVIDARSEGEYAEDHLPDAINWPSLNNEERIRVGTLYKQVSPFEAQKIGAALVAANISRHIQMHVLDKARNWQPLIYCWRGGKRSNSLALILGQIGFKVHLIEGGYKAFRKAVIEDTPERVRPLQFRVLCGPTGSGKTRLLQALAAQGAQVLDLEALARGFGRRAPWGPPPQHRRRRRPRVHRRAPGRRGAERDLRPGRAHAGE